MAGASQEPLWRLSHPSVKEQGRKGDKHTFNFLCHEAQVERMGPGRHFPEWLGVHITSESSCSYKARVDCGSIIRLGLVSIPGPILRPKESSRQNLSNSAALQEA